jgi:GT2 family glycosyltransferase
MKLFIEVLIYLIKWQRVIKVTTHYNNSKTIAAILVTYNRKKLLSEALDALLKQTRPLDSIIIIDNASTDGTPGFLQKCGYLNERIIEYVRLKENTGAAGGFHYGVKIGYEKKCDWLWLMDDDAEPKVDTLEILLQGIDSIGHPNIGAIAPAVRDLMGNVCLMHRGLFKGTGEFPFLQTPLKADLYKSKIPVSIDSGSFVGLLISKKVVRDVGFPDKRFFIHNDDVEYCLRINKKYNSYLMPTATILHKKFNKNLLILRHFLSLKSYRKPFEIFESSRFLMRNSIYLILRNRQNNTLYSVVIKILLNYLKQLIGIIMFDDNKIMRITILCKAYLYGILGKFDLNLT